MVKEYDEQSYQDELDSRFYKGKRPSEERPFTFEDLVYALARKSRNFISEELFFALIYYATDSLEKTCQKCGISRATFYRLKRLLEKKYNFPSRRRPA